MNEKEARRLFEDAIMHNQNTANRLLLEACGYEKNLDDEMVRRIMQCETQTDIVYDKSGLEGEL